MHRSLTIALVSCLLCWLSSETRLAAENGNWVRGELDGKPTPIWGHTDGLRIALAPLPGPRGLLRVYAPYLDLPEKSVINFIAVEPIPQGSKDRGLSELEFSRLDLTFGKRFWSANDPSDRATQEAPAISQGIVEVNEGVEQLGVFILVEPFVNGAHVYLKLTFRADRPYEVGLTTFAHEDSVPLDYCIMTATMGNFARLRKLHLADEVAEAGKLWPDYRGDGFTEHAKFPLARLIRNSAGHASAWAETDESDVAAAEYASSTRPHWKYQGRQATQGWRSENPDPRLEVWVNGRYMYWASRNPIPGGVSFENFEMVSPFQQGAEFIFSVEPKPQAE